MSIALNNKVRALEERILALEIAFSILVKAQPAPQEDLKKIKDDIQGIKMRMGRKEFA